jgi:glutathione reductase (NADPH)
MSYDFDLFVIGGGSGGVRCARIAAGHGARVGIAEARHWGGTCVNVGCVPKKILVLGAEYGRQADDARAFGWHDAQAGHSDWAALTGAKHREVARLNGTYRKLLEGAGVECFEARAEFLDPHTLRLTDAQGGERRVTAARVVIAVGGYPMIEPHIPGADLGIVSDDAFRLPALPRRVLMVGGGYIGVEFAGIFLGLGAEVEMVFRQHLPLRGFDHDIRQALADSLTEQGVKLHASQTVHRVERAGDARHVTLTSGHCVETDLVFFATGRGAKTAGLGLERIGVETAARGQVAVDDENRTSVPHVFAIGDVSNKMNLTPVAIAEGHHLADRLFGAGPARTWALDPVPTAVFSSPPIGTVGLTEEQAAERGPADIYVARFTPMRRAISGRPGKTVMKLVVDRATDRVLGAHMLGDDAPEIVQGLGIALVNGATKRDFDRTIGVHPTSAEEFVTLRVPTRTVGMAAPADTRRAAE